MQMFKKKPKTIEQFDTDIKVCDFDVTFDTD